MQSRHRYASQTTWCKSSECIGDSVQKRSCNRMYYNGGRLMGGVCRCGGGYYGECCIDCVERSCVWNDWGQWGECDRQCGGSGTQLRRRYKQQAESCGGYKCHGDSEEKRSCNRLCHNGGTVWTDGTCHCTNQYHGQYCEHCKARNCVWKHWGRWGECDTYCGDSGRQVRHRSKKHTASCEGNECDGHRVEQRFCKRKCYNGGTLYRDGRCHCKSSFYGQCCEHCIEQPCAWRDCGLWGDCDRTCSGMQYRYRTNKRPASCGGRDCEGDWEKCKTCNHLCYNGGVFNGETCDCPGQYGGQCCQHRTSSIFKIIYFI